MICYNCGAEIPDDSKKCPNCKRYQHPHRARKGAPKNDTVVMTKEVLPKESKKPSDEPKELPLSDPEKEVQKDGL